MDWGAHYVISREVAEACGSTAWLVSLVFSHIMWAARFPGEAQEEFFGGGRDPILGTGSAGGGLLTPATDELDRLDKAYTARPLSELPWSSKSIRDPRELAAMLSEKR